MPTATKATKQQSKRVSVHLDTASDKWKRAFPRMKMLIEEAAIAAYSAAKKPLPFSRRDFEIAVILTDDKTIKGLNHDYRGMNKPTNVLSFPQINLQKFKKAELDSFPPKMPIPLGDVILSFQTIERETREQSKTLKNHTIHLVVHGVLHLLGYDHMRPKDAKVMEKLECDILADLGYPDPYNESHDEQHDVKTPTKRRTHGRK